MQTAGWRGGGDDKEECVNVNSECEGIIIYDEYRHYFCLLSHCNTMDAQYTVNGHIVHKMLCQKMKLINIYFSLQPL